MTFMSTTGPTPGAPARMPGTLGPLRVTPGRWAALAVAVPVALALIGWTGLHLVGAVARGSEPFSYAIPVHNGQLALNVNAGNITLRQGPARDVARLTGTVQYGLARPSISEFTTSDGANFGLDCSANFGGNCGVNANVDVPAQTGVALWSNGGDIAASGFSNGMTLWAGGGNVNVSNLTGKLQLDSGGGDLTASGLAGSLVVDTEGGNVDASGVTAATSVVQSGGGDVTLAFAQVPTSITITAQGGNVTVILPPGSTRYDISTPDLSGGNTTYPQSLDDPNSAHRISIDSGGGDITVSQG